VTLCFILTGSEIGTLIFAYTPRLRLAFRLVFADCGTFIVFLLDAARL